MKRQVSQTLVILALLSSSAHALAADNEHFYIRQGAFSSATYMEMITDDQAMYVVSLLDGINLALFFGADEEKLKHFSGCFPGKNGAQLAKIVSDYIQNNPELLSRSINVPAFEALNRYCQANPVEAD